MNRIQATTWTEEQLLRLIEELRDRFSGQSFAGRLKWADKIERRYQHYHNMAEVDPVVPPPFDAGNLFQTDKLRQVGSELIERVSENHITVRVRPLRQSEQEQRKASEVALALNSGIALIEERQGMSIQQELGYSQVVAAFGVLHWQMAPQIYPALPPEDAFQGMSQAVEEEEPEEQLSLADEAQAMAEEAWGPVKTKKPAGMFLADRQDERAKAGFPWYVECIDPANVMWVPDRSMKNGMAVVVVTRDVGLLDYQQKQEEDGIYISLNEEDKRLQIFEEMDVPPDWAPSAGANGTTLRIYQVWTRDEFYELVADVGNTAREYGMPSATLVTSGEHPYEQPPFAFASAIENNQSDPVLRYEPSLEGMYRIKPFYDRAQTLLDVVSEMVALPRYYLRKIGTGESLLDERGKTVTLSAEAAQAMAVPDGYELAKVEFDMSQAFVNRVTQLRDDLDAAAPPTGKAEISASTQPWAIRLQQSQAASHTSLLIRNQQVAFNTMIRNMMLVHGKSFEEGGFAEPVDVYTRGENTNDGKVVSIRPEDIRSLDVSAEINNVSAAERISEIQFKQGLLNDPKAKYSSRKFLEEALNDPDPDETMLAYDADEAFQMWVKPGIVASEVQRAWGDVIVMGPDGKFYTAQGQAISPEDVLMKNGQQPMAPGGMPSLPGIQTPGTVPLGGMAG